MCELKAFKGTIRKIVQLSFFIFWLPVFFHADAQATGTLLHHDLWVALHPEEQRITGTDHITVQIRDETVLFFDLSDNARVVGVSLQGRSWPFSFKGGHLRVSLPEKLTDENVEITIEYEAFFRDRVSQKPGYTEDPSYGVSGTISPRGTLLLAGARWYPDLPGSMPTFRLRVDAPEGIEAVTSGRRLSRRTSGGQTTSVWAVDYRIPGLALSAGRFRIREREVKGIPIYTYFVSAGDDISERYLEATARYITLYSELFGTYPFDKFAVVENFFPTGYGFPSYTLLGSTVIRLPFIIKTSLGHEVAHCWWGNGVLVDYDHGNWSEGLTTYVADHLYKEMAAPEESREYRLEILRKYASLASHDKDFPLRVFGSRRSAASRAIGYGKAAMVFHMARRMVGDQAFWEGLRDIFREKRFQRASWEDFAVALGRRGKQNLGPFFHQWIAREGAPSLALRDVSATQEGSGWIVRGLLCQQKPHYELQVPVRLETAAQSIETTVHLDGAAVSFVIRSDSAPGKLIVDPEVDIFRRLDMAEVPPTVDRLRGSPSLMVVSTAEISGSMAEAYQVLLRGLGQEKAVLVSQHEATRFDLTDHDILFLGMPDDAALWPQQPQGLLLGSDRFMIEGQIFDSPTDVLFVVLPHPKADDRVIAFFLPLSGDAGARAARKIPHYGKYSYLAFRSGSNRIKGIWPTHGSATVYRFDSMEVSP
jgi:aminopeptidase N